MLETPLYVWIGSMTIIIGLLALDLFVFHRKTHVIKFKEALILSAFWIGAALLFNVGVAFLLGTNRALEFFTAYVVEKSLSVDNLFVFLVIFSVFAVPERYRHRTLFLGILGALLMRATFIIGGIALLEFFHWMIYVFGALLLFAGFKMVSKKETKFRLEENRLVRIAKKLLPFTDTYINGKFFARLNGRIVEPLSFLFCLL